MGSAPSERKKSMLGLFQSRHHHSNLPQPRRVVTGIDSGRLAMICAILEKRCDIYFSNFDIFVNIAGGLKIKTPSIDVPLAASLFSSVFNLPLPVDWAFVGEIGLGGEVREVPGLDIMLKEGTRLGLSRIFAPVERSNKGKKYPGKTEIVRISHIDEIREHTASTNIFDR